MDFSMVSLSYSKGRKKETRRERGTEGGKKEEKKEATNRFFSVKLIEPYFIDQK